MRHVDYQTTSNAKSHAIAGKWYKGYERDPYYCELRSYDDSWNWIETAWFDKEGELVIVSAMSDGEWKNTSTSNWSDFHYNYPPGVDDELRNLLETCFSWSEDELRVNLDL